MNSHDRYPDPDPHPSQYDDDFEDDEEETEEEEQYDDDFEEEEAPAPQAGRAVEGQGHRAPETDIMRAIREENERALLAAAPHPHDDGYGYGDENDRPVGGFDDRAFDFNSHADTRVPERKVKSLPGKGAMKTLTDAQVKAARERVARWEMVIRARHVRMTSSDASCGTDAIIDREPRTVNELFHGGVGPYSRVQFATCQTRGADSSRDVDAQTEDTEGRAVQTQCPEDLVASRDVLEAGASGKGGGSRRKMAASRAARWARASGDLQHSKNKRLGGFIQRAGAVVDALLRERPPPRGHVPDVMRIGGAGGDLKRHARASQAGSLTESYAAFHHPTLTDGRAVADAAFAPGSRGARTLAIAYTPSDSKSHGPGGRGLVLVWDVGGVEPVVGRALTCEGVPARVTWGPGDSHHLLVVGTEEGGLCLWDLREPADVHAESAGGDDIPPGVLADGECLRRPSYCTDGFGSESGAPDDEGDDLGLDTPGSIVALGVALDDVSTGVSAVAPVTPGREVETSGSTQESGSTRPQGSTPVALPEWRGGDFHVVALDCWGMVSSFRVTELSRREAVDASIADMGLRFGSRVRLMRNARSLAYGGGGKRCGRARAMAVTHRVGVAAEFYVAGEDGRVLRGARYGAPVPPKSFVPCDPFDAGHAAASALNEAVVSLDFNPHFPGVFIAAYEGGSVAMYSTTSSLASRRWDGVTSAKVIAARWSPARPSVFLVLDDECCVRAFDLLSGEWSRAVKSERFGKREKITSLTLAKLGDRAWDAPGQCLASMAYDDGRTDVHVVARELSSITEREMDELRTLMEH